MIHKSYIPTEYKPTEYKPKTEYKTTEYKPTTYTNPITTVVTNNLPLKPYTSTVVDYSPKTTNTIDYKSGNYKEYKPKEYTDYKPYESPNLTNTYVPTDTNYIPKSPVRTVTPIENSSYSPTYNITPIRSDDKLNDMINNAINKSDTNLTCKFHFY